MNPSSSTKAKVNAGSNSRSTVTFEFGIGEVAQANLELNYTIEITNGNQNEATVSWSLIGPDLAVYGISDSDSRSAPFTNQTLSTGNLSEILTDPGEYTLVLEADIPLQDFNNNQHSASATLNGVYFEVVPIPEPAPSSMILLTLLNVWRRKRTIGREC